MSLFVEAYPWCIERSKAAATALYLSIVGRYNATLIGNSTNTRYWSFRCMQRIHRS